MLTEALEENLSDLDALVDLLDGSWVGEAHDRFSEHFARWRPSSVSLHRSLRSLHRVTRIVHDNYAAAEIANLRMWGGA